LSHSGTGPQAFGAAFPGTPGDLITATLTEDLGAGTYGATSEFATTSTTTAAGTYSVSGTVFEDIVGDALADGTVGDPSNPGAAGVDVALVREGPTPTAVDTAGNVGGHTAITIGADGNPVVAYHDVGNSDLKVLRCNDSLCSSSTRTVVDTTGAVGEYTSIAIGSDGLPIISYYDATNTSLRVAHCADVACASASTTTVDNAADVGSYSAIAVGVDGLAIVSYYDSTNGDLKTAHCGDLSCSAVTIQTVHAAGDVGQHTSIAIGSDGVAVISYYDVTNADLRLAHCADVACSSATTLAVDTVDDVGTFSSVVIAPSGFPRIAAFRSTDSRLRHAECLDLTCSAANLNGTTGFGTWGGHYSMVVGADGNDLIAGYDVGTQQARLVRCHSASCGALTNSRIDFGNDVGRYASIALGNDGVPVMSYYDTTTGDLKLGVRDGLPGTGDTTIATGITDGTGNYVFASVPGGTYMVSAHSRDVEPSTGYGAGAAGDVWAEQTYGPEGAVCTDGAGGTAPPRGTAGTCYGGRRTTTSDGSSLSFVTSAEHLAHVDLTAGSITGIDFGFSFNVVTNTRGGDAADHDGSNNRTVQGSLRQFIQNANAAAGASTMRFVPTSSLGVDPFWRLTVTNPLPPLTAANTTIDGTAFSFTDGVTVTDTNPGFLGANAGGGATVGVDAIVLPQVEAPELDVVGSGVTTAGLEVRADNTTIRRVAIHRFGDTGTALTDGDIEVPNGFSVGGLTVEENIIGAGAGGLVDPGAGNRSGGSGVAINGATGAQSRIQNNLFGYLDELAVGVISSDAVAITGNEVRDVGQGGNIFVDALSAEEGSTNIEVTNNLIDGAPGNGLSLWRTGGSHLIRNNTITNVGTGGAQTAGVAVFGTNSTVDRNLLTGVSGPAIVVVGENPAGGAYDWPAASGNRITRNHFGSNQGLAIDTTEASNTEAPHELGDGVTLTAGTLATTGNVGLDAPVITDAATTTVSGMVCANCQVEVYRAVAGSGDDSGGTNYGEGVEFLGTVTADGIGDWTLTGITGLVLGDEVSAIAIDATDNTSEFGANVTLSALTVNTTGDAADAIPGDGSCDTGGINSQGDTACTLRAVIEEANALSGADSIVFAIPASEPGHAAGVWTVIPGSELPSLTGPTTLDATTQTGWSTTPVIEVNGTGAGALADGFRLAAGNIEIRGFAVTRFGGDGIEVGVASADAVIAGNHIGLDPTGTIDRGNLSRGIDLQDGSGPTTIGGSAAGDRNLISGNGDDGVIIWNSHDNVIIGNYIGTDITGNSAIPNAADGIALGNGSSNNQIGQPGTTNVLSGNGNDGLEIDDLSPTNMIRANLIGLGVDGSTPVPNGRHGVTLYNGANNTQIGGAGPGEGNVISANTTHGIIIDGNTNAATTANVIDGNLIGLDVGGTLDRGNGTYGVLIIDAANATTIGSNGAGNVISGNGEDGIYLTDTGTDNTVIQSNHLGTTAAGDAAIPNDDRGLQIESGASFTQVGGTTPGDGNVISGNTGDGMIIADWLSLGTTGTVVEGNMVGVAADGSTPLGNGGHGIHLDPVTGNMIGGLTATAGNTIAHNTWMGVQVGPGAGANSILGNSIHTNGGIGIGLDYDGVTPNDSGDGDSGPHDLLNFPAMSTATESGGLTTATGTLDVPAGTYRLEFFANPTGTDPTGHGEGELLMGSTTVVHSGAGAEPWTAIFAGSTGDVITSTTTVDLGPGYGSTSEFSASITVSAEVAKVAVDRSVRRSDTRAAGGLDPSVTAGGVAGPALRFDGLDDRLVGPALDVTDAALTMSGWVNLSSSGTDPRLVAKTTAEGNTVYELLVDSGTGEAVSRISLGGTDHELRGGVVGLGGWHHLAATWDGATFDLHVDGSLVDTSAAIGVLDTDLTTPATVGNIAAANRGLDGAIDHVQLLHRAETPAAIATHVANVNAPTTFVQVGAEQTSSPGSWTVSGVQSRSGSFALAAPEVGGADPAAWAVATGIDEPGVMFETWWWITDDTIVDVAAGTRAGTVPTDEYESALIGPSGWELRQRVGGAQSQDAAPAGTPSTGTWVKVEMWTDQNGDSRIVVDGVEVTAWAAQGAALTSGSVALRAGQLPVGEDWYVDDARARKLVTPEPFTALGPLDRN
ncbi:MAG: beta strand repeat-containing protein, partial [Acidimicrobiales bacterium]